MTETTYPPERARMTSGLTAFLIQSSSSSKGGHCSSSGPVIYSARPSCCRGVRCDIGATVSNHSQSPLASEGGGGTGTFRINPPRDHTQSSGLAWSRLVPSHLPTSSRSRHIGLRGYGLAWLSASFRKLSTRPESAWLTFYSASLFICVYLCACQWWLPCCGLARSRDRSTSPSLTVGGWQKGW